MRLNTSREVPRPVEDRSFPRVGLRSPDDGGDDDDGHGHGHDDVDVDDDDSHDDTNDNDNVHREKATLVE